MNNHKIHFGRLELDGTVSNSRFIKQEDIGKCPFYIMDSTHYREDGSCKCDDFLHREMMIKEWGYKRGNFKGIKIRREVR